MCVPSLSARILTDSGPDAANFQDFIAAKQGLNARSRSRGRAPAMSRDASSHSVVPTIPGPLFLILNAVNQF